MVTVRRGTSSDRRSALRTLTLAFASDPTVRWLFPEEATYPERAEAFFGGLYDLRIDGGDVWVTDDVVAVALWNPPGGNRLDPQVIAQRWQVVRAYLAPDERERLDRYDRFLDGLLPRAPAWYLGVVGIHPDWRRTGLGRSVLAPVLDMADRSEQRCCLETAVEGNLGFYRRLGFELWDDGEVPGGPRVWAMVRHPSRPPNGKITGPAGIIVWTSAERFEAMASFYRDVLGLPPRTERPGFINFEWGSQRLTVGVHGEVSGPSADPFRIMVNLAADDLGDLHRRLQAEGVAFLRPPEREHWGGWVATLTDPDGNILQLLEMPRLRDGEGI